MKFNRFVLSLIIVCAMSTNVFAIEGVLATGMDIIQLKKDLLAGKIVVGKTRLKDVRRKYGDAPTINESDRKITYNYGDLRIDFDKERLWVDWRYDGFRKPVYNDNIEDLRFDLESKELVGENITIRKISKDYDEPTESEETNSDGEISVYYYGNIKMIFKNYFTVSSWSGQNLDQVSIPNSLSN